MMTPITAIGKKGDCGDELCVAVVISIILPRIGAVIATKIDLL